MLGLKKRSNFRRLLEEFSWVWALHSSWSEPSDNPSFHEEPIRVKTLSIEDVLNLLRGVAPAPTKDLHSVNGTVPTQPRVWFVKCTFRHMAGHVMTEKVLQIELEEGVPLVIGKGWDSRIISIDYLASIFPDKWGYKDKIVVIYRPKKGVNLLELFKKGYDSVLRELLKAA